jgi:hypothetical protein
MAEHAMTLLTDARLIRDTLLRTVASRTRGTAMEIVNLGAADGLPPVDWDAIVEKLDTGLAPDPDAHNARTKWLRRSTRTALRM